MLGGAHTKLHPVSTNSGYQKESRLVPCPGEAFATSITHGRACKTLIKRILGPFPVGMIYTSTQTLCSCTMPLPLLGCSYTYCIMLDYLFCLLRAPMCPNAYSQARCSCKGVYRPFLQLLRGSACKRSFWFHPCPGPIPSNTSCYIRSSVCQGASGPEEAKPPLLHRRLPWAHGL